MKFAQSMNEGQFLKRYKRFFADIEFKGDVIIAHVPNTGSLKSCVEQATSCRFTSTDNPNRKLKFTLQMLKTPSSWVGVNTGLANDLVWEAWETKNLSSWLQFPFGRREVTINEKTRFDMAFWKEELDLKPKKKIPFETFKQHRFHFVEVKNVTLAEANNAQFPDAVTTRGQKHLKELMLLMKQGHSCELVFVIQRTDCKTFSPADHIDPEYGRLLRQAVNEGLILSPYHCRMTKTSITLDTNQKLKICL